ncbi:MAG: hypothetical protein EXR92_07480 [Gemmatimonadetes bacterium]|nr:hypothetical protein [Gemmatimonadota bacterium]
MRGTALALLCAGLAVSGCARPGAPVGGDRPTTPLRVIGTFPEQLALMEPFDGPVELRFERTVSERPTEGSPGDAVIVSPQTGPVTVRTSGERIDVTMEGGFRAGTVYRVTVLPRFRDRFQNRMNRAFDLVFSTGGEFEPTLLAGLTQDRLTLRPLAGTRVDAIPLDGGDRRSTVADSTALFTFPYLPSGRYELVAYEDRNRNRESDSSERQASIVVGVNVGDTIVVTDLPLLLPDPTPARVESVALVDSLSLQVTFDDYLDAAGSLDPVTARLVREEANAPEVLDILFRWEWDREKAAAARAAAQTPAAQAAAAGNAATPNAATPSPAAVAAPGPILPSREIVLVISRPLVSGASYRVEVDGVVNLNGVPGGRGEGDLDGPPPLTPGALPR